MNGHRPLCATCSAEWQRVLEPGLQQPPPIRLMHIGAPAGADLDRAALQRADEHWARVRAYQDYIAAVCRTEHAPAPPVVVDLPLPDMREEGVLA